MSHLYSSSKNRKLYVDVVVFATSFASRLHHHTTTDSVEGVGHETSDRSNRLSDHPADNNVCVLGVWKHACKRNVNQEG